MIGLTGFRVGEENAPEHYLPKRLRAVEQAEAYLDERVPDMNENVFIVDNTGVISVRTGGNWERTAQPAAPGEG